VRRRVLGIVLSLIAITPAWAQQRAPDGVTIDDEGHPDSGTGELAGLAGTMTIVIADGKHSYEFDYTLGGTR